MNPVNSTNVIPAFAGMTTYSALPLANKMFNNWNYLNNSRGIKMSGFQMPGPLCRILGALEIDSGTLCLSTSPTSGPVGSTKRKKLAPFPLAPPPLKRVAGRFISPGLFRGVTSKLTDVDFQHAAKSLGDGISVAIIRAFVEVESGGKSGFGSQGRPIIAFEGHIFRKITAGKYDKNHRELSYKYIQKAGVEWRRNNKTQDASWKALSEAMVLDYSAALQSCSWGMFQIMGFNYTTCGYKKIDDFIIAMKSGELGQLEAFLGYCKSVSGLVVAMKNNNFVQMATLYNGSDYGNYDKRLYAAYKIHGGV